MAARYVSFGLAGTTYCMPLDNVVEILRRENLLDVPRTTAAVKGAISLRGEVIPVVDARVRLGLPETMAGRGQRIIVVRHGRRSCGLLVDIVNEIVELEENDLPPGRPVPQGARGVVKAIALREETTFLIVDLSAILALPKEA
jgi:chemotaxis signal transduction protein